MPVTYTNRSGKTYYLHIGPKKGGGVQHFVSTKPEGLYADNMPEGFEIYETVNGQVFLRRKKPSMIQDDELAFLQKWFQKAGTKYHFKIEVKGKEIIVHESSEGGISRELAPHWSEEQHECFAERSARYQPVMRFVLADKEGRIFEPERFCFCGSVDDWISIGPPGTLQKIAPKYLKHLGKESIYDLF